MHRSSLAAALAASLTFAAAAPALGAQTFLPLKEISPVTVGDETNVDNQRPPQAVISSDGRAAVLWSQDVADGVRVFGSVHQPGGGAWPTAQELSVGNGQPGQLAVSPNGEIVAVYCDRLPADTSKCVPMLRVAEGGSFGAAQPVSTDNAAFGKLLASFDGAGRLYVSWTGAGGFKTRVRHLDGTWGSPVEHAGAPGISYADVAVNDAGEALAVWGDFLGMQMHLRAERFGASGDQDAIADVQTSLNGVDAEVAPDGTALVAHWTGNEAFARSTETTTWGDAEQVSSALSSTVVQSTPDLVVSGAGKLATVVAESMDGPFAAVVSTHAGEGWATQVVSEEPIGHSPSIAFDGETLAVAWGDASLVGSRVARAEGGDFTVTAIPGDNDGFATGLAYDGFGNGAVVGIRQPSESTSLPRRVVVHPIDGEAPAVTDVAASHATPVATIDNVDFTVVGFDVWSDFTAAWSFGAAGLSAKHVFPAAGAQTVEVTLTDAGGLSRAGHIEVDVKPAPVAGQPVVEQPVQEKPAAPVLPDFNTVLKALQSSTKAPAIAPASAKEITGEQTFPSAGVAVRRALLEARTGKARSAAAKKKPKAKVKVTVLGTGKQVIAAAGTVKFKLPLSKRGRSALKRATTKQQVVLETTFTDVGGRKFVTRKVVATKKPKKSRK